MAAVVRSPAEQGRPATYGIAPFDVCYGASYAAGADSPLDVECEVVEDRRALHAHRPEDSARPERLAFVDGTMRTDAQLTRTSGRRCRNCGPASGSACSPLAVTYMAATYVLVTAAGRRARHGPGIVRFRYQPRQNAEPPSMRSSCYVLFHNALVCNPRPLDERLSE